MCKPKNLFYFWALIDKNEMMKKWIVIAVTFLLFSCEQGKIGYVDNVKLMDGYKVKQDVEATYQLQSESFARRRDSISQAFQIEAQDLQNRTKNMPQDKAQEEFEILQQRGQLIGQQLQQQEQQMQRMGQLKMDSVVTHVRKTIKEYGAANGYRFILTGGEGGSVLYGESTSDVTDEVLKILNEE